MKLTFLLLSLLLFLCLNECHVKSTSVPINQDSNFPLSLSRSSQLYLNSTASRQRGQIPTCGTFCRFRICNFNGNSFRLEKAAFFLLNAPDTATTPYICRAQTSIGQITATGEASVDFDGNLVRLSKWSPRGLTRKFKSNFFGVRKIPRLPWSTIDRSTVISNQWNFLHDRCFVIPIRGFQIIDSDTQRLLRSETVDRTDRRNCVSFRSTAPQIHVQLEWDSADDFDLSLEEPDGTLIDFRNTRSKFGKLNGDNNKGFCNSGLPIGKENILYMPNRNIPFGTYRVMVTHSNKCGARPTRWTVSIMKNGVVVKRRTGNSDKGGNNKVLNTIFKFP